MPATLGRRVEHDNHRYDVRDRARKQMGLKRAQMPKAGDPVGG
jgi:hypothetical protein